MFNFFKTKNPLGSLITKSVAFCFVAVFIFSAVNANIPAETAYAQAGTPGEYVLAQQNSDTGIFSKIFTGLQVIPNTLLVVISQLLITISSFILWMGGEVFELSIQYSIVNIGNYTTGVDGILLVWRVIRDLANMSFIFILLYAAIQMILGMGGVDIKKLITKILVAALLINFSLFFTQIAIDASNSVALVFYNQIVKTKCGSEVPETVGNIGTAFMCKLGITKIIDKDLLSKLGGATLESYEGTFKIATYGIAGSTLILITAFIFFASALMFIMRFLIFIKLLALSPAAFASIAITSGKYFYKWLDELFKNCMIAPAYMAATWAALTLLEQMGGGQTSLLSAILGTSDGKPATGSSEAFIRFIITIGMMIGTLMVADRFGGYGAKAAIGHLDTARGWAQGKLGRGAVRATGLVAASEMISNSNLGNTRTGRVLRGLTTDKIPNMKFGSKESVSSYNKKLEAGDKVEATVRAENLKRKEEREFAKREGEHKTNLDLKLKQISALEEKNKGLKKSMEEEQPADGTIGVMQDEYSVRTDYASEIKKNEAELAKLLKEKKVHEENIGDKAKEAAVIAAFNKEADRLDTIDKRKTWSERDVTGKIGMVGAVATGAQTGALTGAALGSLVGPAGTVVGGVIGAVGGSFWGRKLGSVVGRGKIAPSPRKAIIKKLREKKEDVIKALIDDLMKEHGDLTPEQREKIQKDYDEVRGMKGSGQDKAMAIENKLKTYTKESGYTEEKVKKIKEDMQKIIEENKKNNQK